MSEAWTPVVLAILGGACMGTYPVFVKTPMMRAAHVHPLIFQGYKSVWVLIIGILLVTWRSIMISNLEPPSPRLAYVFTPWGIACACAWVPAGFAMIASIPRIGVGTAVLIFDSTATLVSFFVFWLVFHEPLREHTLPNGIVYYLAPLYMVGVVAGMAGLVLLPPILDRAPKTLAEPLLPSLEAAQVSLGQMAGTVRVQIEGYALAVLAGVLSAVQYGLVTLAKKWAAEESVPSEALDPLGSWTASLGLGAVLINGLALGMARTAGQQPTLQPGVTLLPGSAAGLLYCAALLLTTAAVQLGGNAIVMAQRNATSLVVSGLWGVLWYREIRGTALLAWGLMALLTVVCVVGLGFEKPPTAHPH